MKYKYVREKGLNKGMSFVTRRIFVKRKDRESPREFMEGVPEDNTFDFVKPEPLAKIKKAFSKLGKHLYSFTKSIAQEVIIQLIVSLLASCISYILALNLILH